MFTRLENDVEVDITVVEKNVDGVTEEASGVYKYEDGVEVQVWGGSSLKFDAIKFVRKSGVEVDKSSTAVKGTYGKDADGRTYYQMYLSDIGYLDRYLYLTCDASDIPVGSVISLDVEIETIAGSESYGYFHGFIDTYWGNGGSSGRKTDYMDSDHLNRSVEWTTTSEMTTLYAGLWNDIGYDDSWELNIRIYVAIDGEYIGYTDDTLYGA